MADQLSDRHIEELKEAFSLFDFNGDGVMKVDDLAALLRSLGQNPKEEDLKEYKQQINTDESESIDFPEFLSLIARKQRESLHDEMELHEAFRVFDKDGTGFLSRAEFEQVLRHGSGMKNEEVELIMDKSLPFFDSAGKLDFEQFVKLVFNKGS